MRIGEILQLSRVTTTLDATDKEGAIRALAELVTQGEATLDPEQVYEVLSNRERIASTGVGSGIAIPHGRVAKIGSVRAALGIHPEGIPFDSVDGEPVRIFVAVLAPEGQPSQHLKTLAGISRVLRDPGVRRRLLEAEGPEALLSALVEAEG
ncbi:MAG: PTS sugar transporter subunit IIA [Myxococcales bacterium]|nr:PTS sugar transporter subunit IIA [Myxococcales bacterium]